MELLKENKNRPKLKTKGLSTRHIELFEQILYSGKTNWDINLAYGYTQKSHSVVQHSRNVMHKLLTLAGLRREDYKEQIIFPRKHQTFWRAMLKKFDIVLRESAITAEFYGTGDDVQKPKKRKKDNGLFTIPAGPFDIGRLPLQSVKGRKGKQVLIGEIKEAALAAANITQINSSLCDELARLIHEQTQKRINPATLKMIYGFRKEKHQVSDRTLALLAEYSGRYEVNRVQIKKWMITTIKPINASLNMQTAYSMNLSA